MTIPSGVTTDIHRLISILTSKTTPLYAQCPKRPRLTRPPRHAREAGTGSREAEGGSTTHEPGLINGFLRVTTPVNECNRDITTVITTLVPGVASDWRAAGRKYAVGNSFVVRPILCCLDSRLNDKPQGGSQRAGAS